LKKSESSLLCGDVVSLDVAVEEPHLDTVGVLEKKRKKL